MARAIPVRNLYYLFLYAWNRFQEGRIVDVSGVAGPELPNLLAKVLLEGIRHLVRRGLDRGYIEHEEDTARLRGRILVGETVGRALLPRALVACRYDELSHNVLHNRILKSTLARLGLTEEVDPELRNQLRGLVRKLPEVATIRLSASDFRRVQLHGNNAFYRFLLQVCELAHEALIAEEGGGRFRFRDVVHDKHLMQRVYQDFVFNFYRLEQSAYQVKRDHIIWDVAPTFGTGPNMLPEMQTDVSLRRPERTIIVDTKWYGDPLQIYRGPRTVRSEHLYQLFAYLKNLERRGGSDTQAEGMLLYPTVEEFIDLAFKVQGHIVRVRTINLDQDWTCIHRDLLALLGPVEARATAGDWAMGL
jgi:5-methylcytosine-specific restriction enzyme subunit McrC